MGRTTVSDARDRRSEEAGVRTRILEAAFAAFVKNGYAATSTLEIATRAHVSKRELYALIGNKREMLTACIRERATRLQVSADLPVPHDREAFARVLASVGTQLVREITDPTVVAVLRLAIADAVHAPEAARALDSIGRETARAASRTIIAHARASGLIEGDPTRLAAQFGGLLWEDLLVSLLLGVVERPNARDIARRGRDAAAAFLQLHPAPNRDR